MISSVRDYAIFMLDPAGRVASWNAGAERLKQYRAHEIIGCHFSRFYSADEVESGKPERHLELASIRGRLEYEGWRIRKDGTRFWASVVISAMRNDAGHLVGFAKVIRDMTERKRAEQELSRRAGQQATVAEFGIHALRTPDIEPVLRKAVELVGNTLGTEISEVFELRDDRSLILRAANGWRPGSVNAVILDAGTESEPGYALLTGEPVLVEDLSTEARFPPGPLQHYGAISGISVCIPLPGQQRPYGVLGAHARKSIHFSADDVSFVQSMANAIACAIGRSRAEEQVRRAEAVAAEERERTARAEEAVRGRDVFLSVAAHELRTPLTALQLKLQSVQAMIRRLFLGTEVAQKGEARLEDALRQTVRLGDLVERLLDVSHIAAGRFHLDRRPLALESIARELISELRERTSQNRSAIQLSVAGDTVGNWDRRRLEQVLWNLLSNALKYGEDKPVEVSIEGRDGTVRLMVRDQGIGIASPDLQRIFDPFERAVPIEHFGGLGLGLYIVRHVVEAHGGTVEVSSKPGAGSHFLITLPRETTLEGAVQGAQESAKFGS